MFYSHSMLSRKGPLATIWLAAYCYHKLKKSQIATTDIASSVDWILPEAAISYRIVAHLLLGVVRIYSKKVDFLYDDCNEALSRVQRSFVDTLRRETLRTHTPAVAQAAAAAAIAVVSIRNKHVKRVRPALPPATPSTPQDEQAEAMPAAKRNRRGLQSPDDVGTSGPRHLILMSPPEMPMIAPYREGLITIPTTFELDSFNLDLPEEPDDDNNHHLLPLPDEQDSKRSYLIQNNRIVDQPDTSFNYACFTPVQDSVANDLIDFEFEVEESRGDGASTWSGNGEDQDRLALVPSPVEGTTTYPKANKSLRINIHAEEFTPSDRQGTHDKAKSSKPSVSGQPTSPQLTVATPAKEEACHFSSKRKRHPTPFDDEAIVLSNETLRKGLDDRSDLLEKRGKAPHTYLDVWKVNKFSDFDRAFVDPLICYNYVEIKDTQIRRSLRASSSKTTALNSKIPDSTTSPFKKSRRTTTKRKSVPISVAGSEAATVPDQTPSDVPLLENGGETNGDVSIDMPMDDIAGASTENEGEMNGDASIGMHSDDVAGASAKTPVDKTMDTASPETLPEKTSDSASVESPADDRLFGASGETLADGELGRTSGEAFAEKGFDVTRPDMPSEVVLSDMEADTENSGGSELFDQNGLSARTRLVGKTLHRAFKNTSLREQGGGLSLTRILDGKKRSACARFFYETLALTTRGLVEVNQESAYGDIIILASSERTLRPIVAPSQC